MQKIKLKQSFHSPVECSRPLEQHLSIEEGRSFSSICMNDEGKVLYIPPISAGWITCSALYDPTPIHRCNVESRWHRPCVLVGFLWFAWVLEPYVLCHMKVTGTCTVRTPGRMRWNEALEIPPSLRLCPDVPTGTGRSHVEMAGTCSL